MRRRQRALHGRLSAEARKGVYARRTQESALHPGVVTHRLRRRRRPRPEPAYACHHLHLRTRQPNEANPRKPHARRRPRRRHPPSRHTIDAVSRAIASW